MATPQPHQPMRQAIGLTCLTISERATPISYDFNIILKGKALKQAQAAGIPPVVIAYGREFNGLYMEWQARQGLPLEGCINLRTVQQIYQPLQADKFYIAPEDEPLLRQFRPVDMFKADACVGIIDDERRSSELYYFDESDRELRPLDVDIRGYILLLPLTLGFLNWQSLLLELATPAGRQRSFTLQPDSYSNTIRDTLPVVAEVVPGWSLPAFVARYDEVKLSAQAGAGS